MPGVNKSAMEEFYQVRYQIDNDNQERTSDINRILSFEGKPRNKFEKIDAVTRYTEYFDTSDEPIAYRRAQAWQIPILDMTEEQEKHFREVARVFRNNSVTLSDTEQSTNPSLPRREYNNKENIMSDENTFYPSVEQAPSSEEAAYKNALRQRAVITEGLKKGTLSCLPGEDGYADTQPAFNIMTGKVYHGANLLYLKEHQKQFGFPTGEYITAYQLGKATDERPDLGVMPNQKSVHLHFSEQNEETGLWEKKNIEFYNIAQTHKPDELKDWLVQKRDERMATQYSESYTPEDPKQKEPGPTIVCTSTEPEKYLGQYLAAVSMGGKFKATTEQAKEFSENLEDTLYQKMPGGHTNPFMLSKISIATSQYCKEVIKEIKTGPKQDQELKQEQRQEHKRGRVR